MKIALCFSGHIRDLNETKNFWTELIERYDVDVYASFWDVENEEKQDTIKNFLKIYTPKKWETDNYNSFKESTMNMASKYVDPPIGFNESLRQSAKEFRQIPMYYKIWKANMLTKDLGIKYDLVVRARTDIALDENFQIKYNRMLNIPMGKIKAQMWPDSHSLTDLFAYGIPDIMDYYSFVFLQAMHYQQLGHYMIPAERLMHVHFNQIRIPIRYFPNYVIITRTWKNSPHEFYNNYVNPPKEEIEWSDEHKIEINRKQNFVLDIKKEFRLD